MTKLSGSYIMRIVAAGMLAIAGLALYLSFTGRLKRMFRPNDEVCLAMDWNNFILDAETHTEGFRGPVASLVYGYVGMAAYEAARPGFAGNHQSMTSRYPGMVLPPAPGTELYDMGLALNACYATILGRFYLSANEAVKKRKNELEQWWTGFLSKGKDPEVVRASVLFGENMGYAVYQWAATDSLGHRANHHNYDRNFKWPEGEGLWEPSFHIPMPPLLPYWGGVRPFVIHTERYLAKPVPEFSTQPNQAYHIQALEIVSLSKPLSAENKWIAEYWHDDRPGITFTPCGRWLAITTQVIAKERPAIEKTLTTYMKVGMALADAMIACWYGKYVYNLLRPETYIQRYIDPDWRPHAPSPSFPAYPSGHSIMGAAAAEVLTAMYGDHYEMTDRSHDGLPQYSIKPRHFNSFAEMARENAMSRIFLGVHWRMDCEEGLRLGTLIGKEVCELQLERKLSE